MKFLKSNPNAEPQPIADVLEKHNISRSQCKSVGRLVMPQLAKQGLEPDDARIAMDRLRTAYSKVPWR
jgi:hypothetical protein